MESAAKERNPYRVIAVCGSVYFPVLAMRELQRAEGGSVYFPVLAMRELLRAEGGPGRLFGNELETME
jgi:hypothetical protein